MIKGHDFIGAGSKHFNVDAAIRAISPGSIVGVFDSTWPQNFGDPMPKIRKLIASGKIAALRIQLWWSYSHVGATADVVKKACRRWEALAKEFPQIHVFLSPSCEYGPKTSAALVNQWLKILRDNAPHCTPILCPMPGAPLVAGVARETHTDKHGAAANQTLSTDGNNIFDADAKMIIDSSSQAIAVMGWGMRYNLAQSVDPNDPHAPQNPAAPLRIAAPSYEYIKSIDVLLYPPLEKSSDLRAPELWKTHAEDKKQPAGKADDPRANRPVLLVKVTGKPPAQVTLLDSAFNKVGSLGLYKDSNPHKLERYYSKYPGGAGLYAWQYGEMAKANTGSSVIYAQIGARRVLIGHAELRAPFFQS